KARVAIERVVGRRIGSGGLLLARTRGVSLMRFVNWSCLMSHVTFGNCFVNSSLSLTGRSNPVSKYAFNLTGAVPQPDVPPEGAPDEDVVPAPGGAHAPTRATAKSNAGRTRSPTPVRRGDLQLILLPPPEEIDQPAANV